ncbi:universal stress protein [Adhaeribacter sp. BT258]|uniref:Universal stress protein n=1 Tax=Adhaeribacter terrigena TaxID=2793070 RepID=A0ABS1BZR6_9BACT|nr:universal stress protein [Adhaeribacter terrigena]MBK0402412.1 universal stress protein [Adhaeribacter terrigena]
MKNILVSTDFSQPAYAAAFFAAELARQTNARLILFHAYHPAILLEEETIWADTGLLEKEVQERIDQLAHELHKTFGLSVTRVLKPGFAVDEMLAVGKKIKADLLIIGTEGAGKRAKNGPGKICQEVLKKAEMPVICLPPNTTPAQYATLLLDPPNSQLLGNTAGTEAYKKIVADLAQTNLLKTA